MNNLDWYTKVTLFCQAYTKCSECPFHILQTEVDEPSLAEKPCFTTKQHLQELSTWLAKPSYRENEITSCGEKEDNQWLKELLQGEFGEEGEDLDAFYLEDDFI